MDTSLIPADGRVVLGLWSDLLEREGASHLIGELQDLYDHGRDLGFFSKAIDAFSITEWLAFGDHMLWLLKVNCIAELLELLAAWKRFELILRDLSSVLEATWVSVSSASPSQLEMGDSRASPLSPPRGRCWSSGNVRLSQAPAGLAASPRPAESRHRSDESLPFLRDAMDHCRGIAEQTSPVLTPRRFRGAGRHRAPQRPAQLVAMAPPPSPQRRRKRKVPHCFQAVSALGDEAQPQEQLRARLERRNETVVVAACPHCGISTIFSVQEDAAELPRRLAWSGPSAVPQ